MAVLEGFEPARFFHYFEQLTKIPRGSGNEKEVSDYVVHFATAHGFTWEQDAANNVKIWVPATPGYEDRKSIALQAHLDMVCASDAEVDFDFKTQPLNIYVEDGYVKARGTTLGADNGVGVAMILALLEREDLPHPPLQAIFTTGEEILFVGAQAMADEWIDSDYMIGLDYSNNKSILAAAAGMSTMTCDCQLERKALPNGTDTVVEIDLSGFQGGHSGNMIHRDRANAIKVMGELMFIFGFGNGAIFPYLFCKAGIICEPNSESLTIAWANIGYYVGMFVSSFVVSGLLLISNHASFPIGFEVVGCILYGLLAFALDGKARAAKSGLYRE